MIAELILVAVSVLTIAACVGLWRFGERDNIVYARLHIVGVIDVAAIYLVLAMGYPLVGLAYLLVMPISVHAIANAKHYGGAGP